MYRTLVVRGLLFIVVLLAAGSWRPPGGHAASRAVAQPSGRPNIVFILVDDLDRAPLAEMPRLRSLLTDAGTSFDNYIVNISLCCPSRSTILRGQYAQNTGVFNNFPPEGGWDAFVAHGDEDSTIASWLQDAGYRTALMGKYLNGYPPDDDPTRIPPGWSEWYGTAGGNGYVQYNYQENENGTIVSYGDEPEDYLNDVLTDHAEDFIRRTAGLQPFFLYLSLYSVHAPFTAPPRYADAFPDAHAPRTPNFNEEDVSDKPNWIRTHPPLGPIAQTVADRAYQGRLRQMLAIEDTISRLIGMLEATGQLENTYIVFTSDNGYHIGNHRLALGKLSPYEEDIRLPLIVRGPGVPAGRVVTQLVANTDFAPTFTDLAGVTPPAFVDGRSFAPLLRGETPPATWRQGVLIEGFGLGTPTSGARPAMGARPAPLRPGAARAMDDEPEEEDERAARENPALLLPDFMGVRGQDFVFIQYETGEREYYDLRADPYQRDNLAATLDPQMLAALSAWVTALSECSATECGTVEDRGP